MSLLSPMNVLLVEDNPGDAHLLGMAIREECPGCGLKVIGDGESAIKYLLRQGEIGALPDLVVLDINLPKRDGSEVLAALRAHPATAQLNVVIFTSAAMDGLGRTASLANRFIRKPSDLDSFLSAGRELIRLSRDMHA